MHLVDWRDRGSVYWRCRRCERLDWWVRARKTGRRKPLPKKRVVTEAQREASRERMKARIADPGYEERRRKGWEAWLARKRGA